MASEFEAALRLKDDYDPNKVVEPARAQESAAPASAESSEGLSDFERAIARPSVAESRPAASRTMDGRPIPAGAPKVPARALTQRQQALAPAAEGEKEYTVGEALREGVSNLPSSTWGVVKSTASALAPWNLKETAQGIKELGAGVVSKAKGAVGLETNEDDQRVINAILDDYATRYGSKQGFLRAVAKDPASILMDASALLTGGSSAAAGATSKVAKGAAAAGDVARAERLTGVSRGLEKARDVANLIDPIQLALKTAKVPLAGARIPDAVPLVGGKRTPSLMGAGRMIGSQASGVPQRILQEVNDIARNGTPEQRKVLADMQREGADHTQVVRYAEEGLKGARDARQAAYQADMRNRPAPVNFAEPGRKIQDLRNQMTLQLQNGTIPVSQDALDFLDTADVRLQAIASEPINSPARSVIGADKFKQSIADLGESVRGNAQAYRVAQELRQSIWDAISRADPQYARIMGEYEDASNIIDTMKGMGVGRQNISDETVLKRLLKATSPAQQKVIDEMAQHSPNLRPAIAGAATSKFQPSGARAIGLGSLGWMFGSWPHVLAAAAAASPQLQGKIQRWAGSAERMASAAAPVASRAAVASGIVRDEYLRGQEDPSAKPQEPEYATPPVGWEGSALPASVNSKEKEAATQQVATSDLTEESRRKLEEALKRFDTPVEQQVVRQIFGNEGTTQNPRGSAYGPYQFINETWRDMARRHYPEVVGDMSDSELNALKKTAQGVEMAKVLGPIYINENAEGLKRNGLEATPANLYLSHFLGLQGAMKALRLDPSTPTKDAFKPIVINSNPEVMRGKTVGDVIAWTERKMQPRQQRKSGGRVDSVQSIVNELMSLTKTVRRETDKHTEPLLNHPDEAVVKALDIAQQAI